MARYPGFEKDASFVKEMLTKHLNQGMTANDISFAADLLADEGEIPLPVNLSIRSVKELISRKTDMLISDFYIRNLRNVMIAREMGQSMARHRGEPVSAIRWCDVASQASKNIARP